MNVTSVQASSSPRPLGPPPGLPHPPRGGQQLPHPINTLPRPLPPPPRLPHPPVAFAPRTPQARPLPGQYLPPHGQPRAFISAHINFGGVPFMVQAVLSPLAGPSRPPAPPFPDPSLAGPATAVKRVPRYRRKRNNNKKRLGAQRRKRKKAQELRRLGEGDGFDGEESDEGSDGWDERERFSCATCVGMGVTEEWTSVVDARVDAMVGASSVSRERAAAMNGGRLRRRNRRTGVFFRTQTLRGRKSSRGARRRSSERAREARWEAGSPAVKLRKARLAKRPSNEEKFLKETLESWLHFSASSFARLTYKAKQVLIRSQQKGEQDAARRGRVNERRRWEERNKERGREVGTGKQRFKLLAVPFVV